MGRVRNVVARANQRLSVQLAAGLLAGSTFLSMVLGLFRDRLLNSTYAENAATGSAGYPSGLDAYTVAFIIPDFMFFLLVSGALSVTFIPVFNDRIVKGNKKSAWELSTSLVNFMAILTLLSSLFIIIFAEPLVQYIVAPGLDESTRSLAVSMMRVIAINPFLFAISSVISSIQQATGRFVFFALAPVLYNIGIIIGLTVFTNGIWLFGVQVFEGGIMGVALGIVLGSMLQLILSAIGLIGLGVDYRFKIFWKNKGFRQVLRLLPPRSLDQGMDYVNSIVETNLASRMAAGSVRFYQQATTLYSVPINLIGVAISTAAFPQMTERLSQGRPDLFKKELQTVLRVIIWLALPVATITFFARGYLVNFLFNGGQPVVAGLLGILSAAILFRSVYHIASRSFYAQKDTKTPLYISVFTIGLNIALAIYFTMVLDMDIYGLAWAQSIVAAVEVFILFVIMSMRIPKLFDAVFLHAVARMLSATGFTAVVAYFMVNTFALSAEDQSFMSTFPKFSLIVIVSLGAYLLLCQLMKLDESDMVIKRTKRLIFDPYRGKESTS
ncbi:TPA: murein biosynthesis integral membrane protein MurJ [Candidatus Saccharibacteria bacterium]|nr:murein biosynthesis integral membrane protein MurJ [Candidatus Saccharibacteria bacterium]HRK40800.1 murein biosynthesis integral membrane protein MurJ [Candidatus Saccharibacteria bacterium]